MIGHLGGVTGIVTTILDLNPSKTWNVLIYITGLSRIIGISNLAIPNRLPGGPVSVPMAVDEVAVDKRANSVNASFLDVFS